MKLARDQRFYWTEPREYVRAKSATAPKPNNWVLVSTFSALFGIPLALANPPSDLGELAALVAFAIGSALLIVLALIPLLNRMPNSVLVASNRFVVGRNVIWFKDVAHAIVGTTNLEGQNFPVLSVQTKVGRAYLFGLGSKVNAHELSGYLEQAGLYEPQA